MFRKSLLDAVYLFVFLISLIFCMCTNRIFIIGSDTISPRLCCANLLQLCLDSLLP